MNVWEHYMLLNYIENTKTHVKTHLKKSCCVIFENLGVANKTWCVTQNLAFYIHPVQVCDDVCTGMYVPV